MRSFHGGPSDRKGYHHGNLKEALVEAARRFIAERGLGGFTLVDAARLAGVTPAALYRHFSGRDALVSEVAGRGFTPPAERLRPAVRVWGPPPGAGNAPRPSGAFALLVEALTRTFPDGFGGIDPRFIALEVWALSHGIATLDAAGQLPKGPGLPDKYELLRAGVLALVHGALKGRAGNSG